MKVVSSRTVQLELSKLLDELHESQEPMCVSRYGKPVAVMYAVSNHVPLETSTKCAIDDSTTLQKVSEVTHPVGLGVPKELGVESSTTLMQPGYYNLSTQEFTPLCPHHQLPSACSECKGK